MTTKHNIEVWKGETFDLSALVRDDSGVPMDLSATGYEVHFELSTGQTYAGTTDDAGVVEIKVSDETTATWPSSANYRLRLDYPNGDVKFLLVGDLTVRDWTTV